MALKFSMVLEAIDRMSAPLKRAASALPRVGQNAKGLSRDFSQLDRKTNRLSRTLRQLRVITRRPSILIVRGKIDGDRLRRQADATGRFIGRGMGLAIGGALSIAIGGLTSIAGQIVSIGKKVDSGFGAKFEASTKAIAGHWETFLVKIGKAGVFDLITAKLASVVAWLDRMKANGNMDAWAKSVARTMKGIADSLSGVDWPAVAADIIGVVSAIGKVVGTIASIGGGGLSGLFNVGVVGLIGKIASGLYGLASALGVVSIAGAPLWVVVGVIAAIAAGAFLVYRNWDKISAWFIAKWAAVVGVFNNAKDSIVASLTNMWARAKKAFMDGVSAIWNALPGWMRGVFNGATFAVRGVVNLARGQSLDDAATNAARDSGLISPRRAVPAPRAAPAPRAGPAPRIRGRSASAAPAQAEVSGRIALDIRTERGTSVRAREIKSGNVGIDLAYRGGQMRGLA